MNLKIIYALIGTVLILASCGDINAVSDKKSEIVPNVIELKESDLFNSIKIMAFLANEVKHFKESNSFFLKGIDAYKNKKNLDSAVYFFRSSLLKEPQGKAYFELGNVYMDRKEYEMALKSYNLAEELSFEPFSKILYNKACIFSLQKKEEKAGNYLESALQAGYNNIDHIHKDPDLSYLRETHHFEEAMNRGMRGMSEPEKLFWLQFKRLFSSTELPLKLNPVLGESEFGKLSYISYDFEKYIAEMRDEKFSREVGKGFYYYVKAYESENYVALVYVVKDEFMGEMAPVTYRLATFTNDGTLIDKEDIGGRQNYEEPVRRATLKKNSIIEIDLVNPVYDKDTDEFGYYENQIKEYKKIGKMIYRILDNGKIKLETEEVASN